MVNDVVGRVCAADGDHPNLSELCGPYLKCGASSSRLEHCAARGLAALLVDAPWERYRPRAEGERAWQHTQHHLQHLTDSALWQEAERARFLLAWLKQSPHWIAEHYRAAQAEQARRGKGAR